MPQRSDDSSHVDDASHEPERPDWAPLIDLERGLQPSLPTWVWRGAQLVHRSALDAPLMPPATTSLHHWIVKNVYANQNQSRRVRAAVKRTVASLPPGSFGLNLGAGGTRLGDRFLNIDIVATDNVDIVTRGARLPFREGTLGAVVSQEVLEHLNDPDATVAEVHRVLSPGGVFYCQVPFIIGYHPGPEDFWRFTREGVRALFREDRWDVEDLGISVGHATGFYRIAVEFAAVTASALHPRLYHLAKGGASVAFSPVKYLDVLTERSQQGDRICGGYYCIARKRSALASAP